MKWHLTEMLATKIQLRWLLFHMSRSLPPEKFKSPSVTKERLSKLINSPSDDR